MIHFLREIKRTKLLGKMFFEEVSVKRDSYISYGAKMTTL